MNNAVRQYLSQIGAKGGKAGRGKSKSRTHTSSAMMRYWDDVRAGHRKAPDHSKRR